MILGYARCSTVEQAAEGRTSLTIQENVIRGYAMAQGADRFGVQMYVDVGESGGTPLKLRENGSKLVEDARPGDVIVAAKLDRLFRSPKDALDNAERWHADGIKLVLYDLGTEPVLESATAKFFFAVLSAAAGFERDRIAERMQTAKAAKRKAGGHAGGRAPYGMKIVGHGRDAKLEINDSEQQIAAEIRQQVKAVGSISAAVHVVKARGLVTRSGQPFHYTQIKRIVEQVQQ